MKKNPLLRFATLAAMAFGLAACDLAIENPTEGDTRRVLGSPEDAEALVSTYWKRWMSGVYGSTGDLQGMANVMSFMNYSSLANNCQNSHIPFTGFSNNNGPGNVCGGEQVRLYSFMNEVARVSSSFLTQMDNGLVLGATVPAATDARNLRGRAWAEFLRGLSLGYLALMHDSSSIVSPKMETSEPECNKDVSGTCTGLLKDYRVVMDSALAAFARAIAYTNTTPNPSGDGFPIPDSWMPGTIAWDQANFVRLIRSYRARLRANLPRTEAEAATVDWAAVDADVQNGLNADYYVVTSTTTGPGYGWRQQYNSYDTWHQMPPFFIGMADQSGAYEAWISTPLTARGAGNNGFFMVTADLRFPQGATRSAQQSDFTLASCSASSGGQGCKRYFFNRPTAEDVYSGDGWGWSNYGFARFRSWAQRGDAGSARNGKTLFMTKSELDLIRAEALYRLGGAAGTNDVTVAALINGSRTRGMGPIAGFACPTGGCATGGGLPSVLPLRTAAATGTMPSCIPKVPTGPTGPVVCGTLWDALKYEKRIETAYTHYAPWYLDGRRWNDLAKDIPLYWPVPFQDLQARGRQISELYGTGPNNPGTTATGSAYGW